MIINLDCVLIFIYVPPYFDRLVVLGHQRNKELLLILLYAERKALSRVLMNNYQISAIRHSPYRRFRPRDDGPGKVGDVNLKYDHVLQVQYEYFTQRLR